MYYVILYVHNYLALDKDKQWSSTTLSVHFTFIFETVTFRHNLGKIFSPNYFKCQLLSHLTKHLVAPRRNPVCSAVIEQEVAR